MAIIYSYPELLSLEDRDLLLISDLSSNKNPTRSVKLGNLAKHINMSTVSGTGTSKEVAFWNTSTGLTSDAGFTYDSNTDILFVNAQYQVKQGVANASYSLKGDEDTGLGSFDGNGQVGLVSNNIAVITAKDDKIEFNAYVSTSTKAGANALDPIQTQQALTADTLAELCVDPEGKVVRGSQEATWTFTNAQLNALTNAKITLLSAPGSGKIIVVEESNWLMESTVPGSGNFLSNLVCEIDGISSNAVATQMITARMTELAAGTFGGLGIYSRDVPELNRVYRSNVPMTIRAPGGINSFPSRCISIALKIKYRVFDKNTF